ncbi:metallophosphoesterase [Leuconostoc citreum]
MNDLRKLEKLEQIIQFLSKELENNNLRGVLREAYEKKLKDTKSAAKMLKQSKSISLVENRLTDKNFEELKKAFELFPENRRRSVHKIIRKGDYFNIEFDIKASKMIIRKKDKIVYSAIPYDTGRNYIQRAAILTFLYPNSTKEYLVNHESNIMKYITESLTQTKKPTTLAKSYYDAIFSHPLFMIQILGRMLQHDETGPLSANLPGKFLYDVNLNTGITGYLVEFLKFIIETTSELPIATDGERVIPIENVENNELTTSGYHHEYISSYSKPNFNLLPNKTQNDISEVLMTLNTERVSVSKPMLHSQVGEELKRLRKNYIAHSISPSLLEPMFKNVLPTRNNNSINVVSDIHSLNGKLPFENDNFNILVGDLSDSFVENPSINGLIVIGNHELSDIITLKNNETFLKFQAEFQKEFKEKSSLNYFGVEEIKNLINSYRIQFNEFLNDQDFDSFDEFKELFWFRLLFILPDESWPYLPIGDSSFYEAIKSSISKRFPNMAILNNEALYYHGVRYIGLTNPVSLIKRKLEVQKFMFTSLKNLLGTDYTTPTIIISHAPLFNELSMLSSQSMAYSSENNCSLDKLYKLFENYNIIGAIHGHHHIPSSKGRSKSVNFGGKQMFIICSIYSKVNTGLELQNIIGEIQHVNKRLT